MKKVFHNKPTLPIPTPVPPKPLTRLERIAQRKIKIAERVARIARRNRSNISNEKINNA